MKLARHITVGALSAALLAVGVTVAIAKPDPEADALAKRADAAFAYHCNNDHDAAYYQDFRKAQAMSTHEFTGDINPYDIARENLFRSETEKALGMDSPPLNDEIRTKECTTHRDAFITEAERIIEEKKSGLKPGYHENEVAVAEFPQKKIEAFERAIDDEKRRGGAGPSATPNPTESFIHEPQP